jgi:hypothetical protein
MSRRCGQRDLCKSDKLTAKQEVIMSVLNQAPPTFSPEFCVAAVTGYTATDDGKFSVLRTLTAEGFELRLIVPTDLIEAMTAGLRAAADLAHENGSKPAGSTSVFTPTSYEVITTPNYPGVLLAFDRGQTGETVIGLGKEAAIEIGRALREQASVKSPLIVPEKELIK